MNLVNNIESENLTIKEKEKLINEHLHQTASLQNGIIIYTDLKRVIYSTSNSVVPKGAELSDKYITLIKSMFYDCESIKIKNGNIISINDDLKFEIIKGQIIVPLVIDKELIGSLICFNANDEFENYEFQFAATALKYIKTIVKKNDSKIRKNAKCDKVLHDINAIIKMGKVR